MTEHAEQKKVIRWARYNQDKYPALRLLHSTPNGSMYGQDRRMASIQARRQRDEGLLPGIPDLHLPCPMCPDDDYASLYIEMKWGRNKITDDQNRVMQYLQGWGNCVKVCYSAEEAIDCIKWYLGIEENDGN